MSRNVAGVELFLEGGMAKVYVFWSGVILKLWARRRSLGSVCFRD
jgi:hypothetical protein